MHCGFRFPHDFWYYSEHHARAVLERQRKVLYWCAHCRYVSEFAQAKFLGILPSRRLKFVSSYSLDELPNRPFYGEAMNERGGLCGFHLLRMVWFCVQEQAKFQYGDEPATIETLRILLKTLPGIPAAMAILAVSNTDQSLDRAETIHLAVYRSEGGTRFLSAVIAVLETETSLPNVALVREFLSMALAQQMAAR